MKLLFAIKLSFLCICTSTSSVAQKIKAKTIDDAIAKFMNSPEVVNNFKHCGKAGEELKIIDLNSVAGENFIKEWRGYKIEVLKKGFLVDSLKSYDAHYLLKNRCNYYVLMYRKDGRKSTIVALRHGCTNIVSSARISQKKKQLYINKIESSVW
jgi:hypothetical protein